jgi:hypothetical protein
MMACCWREAPVLDRAAPPQPPRIVLDQVAADGDVVPATIIDISQSSIGIGVRKDALRPSR